MSDFLWSHGLQQAKPPCPLPTPGVYSNSCPLSQWCHPTVLSTVVPFSSCLQSYPASGSFEITQFLASGGQRIGSVTIHQQNHLALKYSCWNILFIFFSDYGETFYRICILSIILSYHTIIVHVFLAVDLQQAVIYVMSSYTLIISLEKFPSILNIGDNSMVRSKTVTINFDSRQTFGKQVNWISRMGLTDLVWILGSAVYHCFCLLLVWMWVSFEVSSPFHRSVQWWNSS